MTRVIAVDEHNDIYIGSDGRLALRRDLEAVMQACQHAAQAQLGEMVLAMGAGVPNFQTVWRGAANLAQFEAYVRKAIMSVEHVTSIQSFSAEVAGNVVRYSATIKTTFGEAVING